MTISNLKSSIKDYAKDIKLNITGVLDADNSGGLSQNQVYAIALASAYSTKQADVITALEAEVEGKISDAEINAAKSAAAMMAMNNIYYRFVHLVSDNEYANMPAGLRMNVIANPGVEKIDFELYSLAVSAINGCGMCIDAHVNQAVKHGVSKQAVQHTIKIGAVINAAAQALAIG